MAWVRPRRSRAGQEGGVTGNSGGTGGSSLPVGGPAALGGGDTGLGAEAGGEGSKGSVPPAGSGCRRPLLPQGIQAPSTGPPGRVTMWCSLERPPLINASSVPRKSFWLPSDPARTISMSRSARAMVAARRGGREHEERRRGGWQHQQRCQATAKNELGHKANSLDRKCQLLAATLSLI